MKACCLAAGHAYAAAISACATGGEWRRAVSLFDGMLENSIQPDVVSCTALISALAADGQWQHAEHALEWMLQVCWQELSAHVVTRIALLGLHVQLQQLIDWM